LDRIKTLVIYLIIYGKNNVTSDVDRSTLSGTLNYYMHTSVEVKAISSNKASQTSGTKPIKSKVHGSNWSADAAHMHVCCICSPVWPHIVSVIGATQQSRHVSKTSMLKTTSSLSRVQTSKFLSQVFLHQKTCASYTFTLYASFLLKKVVSLYALQKYDLQSIIQSAAEFHDRNLTEVYVLP